jgi:transcriptional regulator GlxA family with amidase domain
LAGCGADIPLPPANTDAATFGREQEVVVEALKPRGVARPVIARPVIAIAASNSATETTDFLLTHAVLQRAAVAEVHAVALRRGRVQLYPALQVEVAQDFAGFDRSFPSGADYVIVPAMHDGDDPEPEVIEWVRQQAHKGALVIGVCAGGLVLGRAGLLDGRRFTTHWYYRNTILERHPGATYVPHRRYVVDGNVATTSGVTASIPAMITLVEASMSATG